MSHEITTRPLPIINPEPEYEWYYFIPLLDRKEWDGIEYDQIKYDWNELDYRFGVEYNPIPEPADAGVTIGIFLISFIFVSLWIKKFF
jgi:hypothetical protein